MTVERQLLDWAEGQLACCRLCPRQCRVNRRSGQTGRCGAGAEVRWFLEYVGYGEEPELTPSHTLFLAGCSLGCVFCHTADDAARLPHQVLTSAALRSMVARGRDEGAINLNLLGGEPSIHLPGLLRLFAACAEPLPPIVWNTSMYCSAECLAATFDWVHLYAADLKVFGPACAARLLDAEDYPAVARARFLELRRQCPERILVRHLVLPGHWECCTLPALRWLAAELPGARVSLQDFLPPAHCREHPELGRFLAPAELERAMDCARSLGLEVVDRLPVAGLPQPAAALDGQLARGRAAGSPAGPLQVGVVISPDGRIFLKPPTRIAAGLAAAALRNPIVPTRSCV